MKITNLVKTKKFQSLKWNEKITLKCNGCNDEITRTKTSIHRAAEQKYENVFCSVGCQNKYKSKDLLGSKSKLKTKICSGCKKRRNKKEFNNNKTKSDGLSSYCKSCTKKVNKKHYKENNQNHKEVIKKQKKLRQEILQQYIIYYLEKNHCIDCGEDNIIVLDFDHFRDKKYDISKIVSQGFSIQILKDEIEKCVVRCSNCHRIKTAEEQKNYRWVHHVGKK